MICSLTRLVWPSSLTARVAFIIIGGLILAQLATGTIWSESRRREMLEIPTRVFAARVADAVRLVSEQPPEDREGMARKLGGDGFSLEFADQLPLPVFYDEDAERINALITQVIAMHLGTPAEIRLLQAQLLDDDGKPASNRALWDAQSPAASFVVAVHMGDGWIIARGVEGENGAPVSSIGIMADYVLRIYFLRFLAVALLTYVAVRLALAPLKRMTNAAEALGRDIHSPPLDVSGPKEVRQAAEAFNVMQDRLVTNIEERTRFLAAVSHDLRTPITRLRLRTELLPSEELKAAFRNDLSDMEAMVDDTLEFISAGSDNHHYVLLDVDALIAAMVDDLVEQNKPVSLAGRAGSIMGFEQSLKRGVQNLVDNALRYGHTAHLTLTGTDDYVEITVEDEGPGIADAHLEAVLEPFYRLDASRNNVTGGFGLGLSIASTVAKAHTGTLRLSNRESGGLAACLRLARRQNTSTDRRGD